MGNYHLMPCPCGLNTQTAADLAEDDGDTNMIVFNSNTSTTPPTLPPHFSQIYNIGELLGAGTTSRVFRVHRRKRDSLTKNSLQKSMYNIRIDDSFALSSSKKSKNKTFGLNTGSNDSYELVPEKSLFVEPQSASTLPLACKIIDKTELALSVEDTDFVLMQLRKEIGILRRIVHNNIVRYFDYTETANHILIITECLSGGELFHHLAKKGPLSEQDAKRGFWGLFSAVAYLHDRGIIHRDIKPENVLLACDGDVLTMKFIDFGFSTISKFSTRGSFLGTGGYIAPEIRQGRSYTYAVDDWAMGVLLYCSLCARLPFGTSIDLLPLKRDLCRSQFPLRFPPSLWAHVSEDCKDLIKKLLVVDPLQRLTSKSALQHPWFADIASSAAACPKPQSVSTKDFHRTYLHPSLHSHDGGKLLEIEEMHSPLRKMRSMLPLETKGRALNGTGMTYSRSSNQLLSSSLDYDQLQLRIKQSSCSANKKSDILSIATDSTFVDSEVDLGDSDTVESPPPCARKTVKDSAVRPAVSAPIATPTTPTTMKKHFSEDNLAAALLSKSKNNPHHGLTTKQLCAKPLRKRREVKFFGDELHDQQAGILFFSTYIPCYENNC